MSPSETGSDVSPSSPVVSPGRALAAAREAWSLSPADLAVRLRLDPKIVIALERDDFENLPAATFIKGYVRSIAKELHIDAQSILDSYAAHTALEPPELADFSSRAPNQIGTSSAIIKAISYGVGVTLIVLMAVWWRSNYQTTEIAREAALEPEPVVEANPKPFSYPYEILDDEPMGSELNPQETPVLERETDNPVETPILEPEGAEPDLTATPHLLIATTEEAWVEVYDRNGSKLYYGLTREDQPIEIDTETYYRLTLGNTDSISLHYNGEEIDLAPYSKDGVAQLELGVETNETSEQNNETTID